MSVSFSFVTASEKAENMKLQNLNSAFHQLLRVTYMLWHVTKVRLIDSVLFILQTSWINYTVIKSVEKWKHERIKFLILSCLFYFIYWKKLLLGIKFKSSGPIDKTQCFLKLNQYAIYWNLANMVILSTINMTIGSGRIFLNAWKISY